MSGIKYAGASSTWTVRSSGLRAHRVSTLPATASTQHLITRAPLPHVNTLTMESPGSDLSDYPSDDFPEDAKPRHRSMDPPSDQEMIERPSKRPRLNLRAPSSPPPGLATTMPPDDVGEISEDTDGSVPASPNHHPGMSQDDDWVGEQITICKWEGCTAGDLHNMDNLVEHLHDDHIGTRQKKYSCEWSDCTRKGIPHASGYALRAHMRSHTREKPFYCTLPGMWSRNFHDVCCGTI